MNVAGYRLGAELVHTTQTLIHRAVREGDHRPVIIKTLSKEYPSPAEIRRLEFEYRIANKLRGPGVIDAIELVHSSGTPALVLEDFGGESLGALDLPLAVPDFLHIASQIVSALGRIHAAQVIHKDVKPSNLLINADASAVKFIDFQLASEISRERQDVSVTNQLEGSLPYMSPEQTGRMNRSLDYRSDYYSLGVTFFELLTGRLPFEATDVMGWVHCHIGKIPPRVHELNARVPASLSAVVHKLLAKEPRERYQSARGLLADLERCLAALAEGVPNAEFPLGQSDVSERFGLAQELVGRAAEVRELVQIFETASRGPGKLLLVSGYSGIGKSSLIREVHRPISAKHGYFISGKFDQLERSLPYAALLQAVRALLRQILSESDAQVQAWRAQLQSALGEGASVLAEVVPELTQVLGPQPPATPLDPLGAQNRFKFVFSRFLRAVATEQHPLVLVLDDLQWADSSTLELMADLFTSHELRHTLVIGAYRDNEIANGHLLLATLRAIKERAPQAISELLLKPLGELALCELVAGTLECTPKDAAPLAREIHRKTEGNPFFASELLTTLYREGIVSFDPIAGRWGWDLDAVRRLAASDNVVDLMVHRLNRLASATLEALQVGACVGNTFSLSTLASLLEVSPDAAARLLWEPIREELIVPLDDAYRLMTSDDTNGPSSAALEVTYRFQHDRVQQSAYSLIPESERSLMHLRIGRKLLASASSRQPADIFAVTNHLNLGRPLMVDRAERVALAELNRKAGAKAFLATAFAVAAKYHDAGAACLDGGEWAEERELCFGLFFDRVGSLLMDGQRERAAELCEQLFELAPSKAERGRVYLKKCEIMAYQGKFLDAVNAVREGLALFGIDFPADPAAIDQGIGAGIGKMQAHLARVAIADLPTLPDLVDPEQQVAMQLLFQAVPPAIMTYPPLFILAELLMFDLALCHGTLSVSAKNFVDCGMIQGAVLGDYARAYQLGQIAFKVLDRYQARELASSVNFVFAAYVSPWGAPYPEALEAFRLAQRQGIESGDHMHLAYAQALYLRMLISLGRPLDECDMEAGHALALFRRIHAAPQLDAVRLCQRAIDQLRSESTDAAAEERIDERLTHEIVAGGNAQWGFQHGQIQTLVSVLMNDYDAALEWSEFTRARLMAASSLLTLPEYYLCECLVITQKRWPEASAEERPALAKELDDILAKLRGWSKLCPENMLHKAELAAAEIARLRGEPLDVVLEHYDRAAESTGDGFLHLRALAKELSGRFWLERKQPKFAQLLMRDALRLYLHWGAVAKVVQLEAELLSRFGRSKELFEPANARSTQHSSSTATVFDSPLRQGAMDLNSVLKATQAISSEVKSEGLFARLMSAILENAGAEHGSLILPDEDGSLWVRARAEISSTHHDVSVHHPLAEERRVCPQMVRYVARSLEVLVIDEAVAHPDFGSDEYVQRTGLKSVLCMPIVNQRGLVAVLYIENNATTFAFTAQRVETLRLIAGQAAISITNASLYESLERKVEERTRELRAKTRKVAAMLDGMQQGVFTIDEQLDIQPEYSRHLEQIAGTTEIVGRSLGRVLFAGADLGPDVLATNESALRFSFGSSLAIANANAEHLVREFSRTGADGSRQHFEVDWNWIAGENKKVDKVLVTARDVTKLRRLEQDAASAARESALVSEILDAGLDAFRSFCDAAHQSLKGQLARAREPGRLDRESVRALFRAVHTLKGHARVLGLSHLVTAAHAAEEACSAEGPADSGPFSPIFQGVGALDALIAEYEATGEKKLGRLWVGAEERFKQAIGAIEAALNQPSGRPSYPVRALSQVRHAIHRLNAVPLDQVLRETARVFPSLAEELGKSVPELDWHDDGTLLDPEWGRLIKDAFVHTFRNSLDHGIETPEERTRAGKSPQGKIALRTERDDTGVRIHLADDGRGLALEALRSQLGQSDSPDQVVAESIFEFGVSTAKEVSQVSGRGVGMDAVRGFLREHGGDVSIEFTGAAQRGYRPFELIFRLPKSAALPS